MAFFKEKISKEMFNFYNQFKFTTDGFEKPLVATDGDDWWLNKERELFFINAGQMKECYKKYSSENLFCWNFGRVYLQISGLFPRRYIMEFFVNPNITGFLDNH